MENIEKNNRQMFLKAVEIIKTAILQGQYEAAKGVNRIQLAVYFGIGKYISLNTRHGVWGTGALEFISQILRKEMPGLRGFSANSLKNMRKFYENWKILDKNCSTKDIANSTSEIVESHQSDKQEDVNSTSALVELKEYTIDIHTSFRIPEINTFPLEDFFKVPFTHHIRIIEGEKKLHTNSFRTK